MPELRAGRLFAGLCCGMLILCGLQGLSRGMHGGQSCLSFLRAGMSGFRFQPGGCDTFLLGLNGVQPRAGGGVAAACLAFMRAGLLQCALHRGAFAPQAGNGPFGFLHGLRGLPYCLPQCGFISPKSVNPGAGLTQATALCQPSGLTTSTLGSASRRARWSFSAVAVPLICKCMI